MLLINLYGGPGCGKSTTATGVFSKLKQAGINAEYVSEYAKDKVWDKHEAIFDNQIYVFANQHHRVFRLLGQVDVVITDSPLILSLYYNRDKTTVGKALDTLIMEAHHSFNSMNVFLKRVKVYNPKGRMQTENESRDIDKNLRILLDKHDVSVVECIGNSKGIDLLTADILKKLKSLSVKTMYKYYCHNCGHERDGLLDTPPGIGGWSHDCPHCKTMIFNAHEVEVEI